MVLFFYLMQLKNKMKIKSAVKSYKFPLHSEVLIQLYEAIRLPKIYLPKIWLLCKLLQFLT